MRIDRFKTFINENSGELVYDLDYLLDTIKTYTKDNKNVNVSIDAEKDSEGKVSKIFLTAIDSDDKNKDEKIVIEDNNTTNDFYHVTVNGTKEENVPTESIIMDISNIFDMSKYNN